MERTENASDRNIAYDYIRVIACICIIGIHSTVYQEADLQGKTEILNYILHSFFRIGLPAFFMLSGALILNSRKEISAGAFYCNRLVKTIIPFVFYSLFYFMWKKAGMHVAGLFSMETYKDFGVSVFEGIKTTLEDYQQVQLWFMYSIIGIYVAAPFLKSMLHNMTERQLKELTAVLFVMRCVINYFPQVFGFQVKVSDYIFKGWVIYFILGYIIVQDFIRPYYKFIVAGGILVFPVSMYMALHYPGFRSSNHFDLAPHMMIQACAFFCLIYAGKEILDKGRILNKTVCFVSRYTYSMYMLQFFMLTEINRLPVMNGMISNELIESCIRIAAVFTVSLAAAIIADNTIIKFVQYLCGKIGKTILKTA